MMCSCFFFNDTATTEIYTLSLPDALPISIARLTATLLLPTPPLPLVTAMTVARRRSAPPTAVVAAAAPAGVRSEEHTSELQSRQYLVCRLLLEKKKTLSSPCYRRQLVPTP